MVCGCLRHWAFEALLVLSVAPSDFFWKTHVWDRDWSAEVCIVARGRSAAARDCPAKLEVVPHALVDGLDLESLMAWLSCLFVSLIELAAYALSTRESILVQSFVQCQNRSTAEALEPRANTQAFNLACKHALRLVPPGAGRPVHCRSGAHHRIAVPVVPEQHSPDGCRFWPLFD